jgi:hypothetical protein
VISALPSLTHAITGFFIIEREVIQTTRNFRSERDIEELWVNIIGRLTAAIEEALKRETEPEVFLRVKENLLAFILTLEASAIIMWITKLMC